MSVYKVTYTASEEFITVDSSLFDNEFQESLYALTQAYKHKQENENFISIERKGY